MPYTDSYFHVEPDGAVAYAYVYYPTFGWSWVLAPWVLGWGPRPYWGRYGVNHYGWHERPWFRVGPRWRAPAWGARMHRGRPIVMPPQRPVDPRRREGERDRARDRERRGPEPRERRPERGRDRHHR
ncbi:MAG: hypothetical protein AAB426_01145 [Myxococcota bacterium]